jgi:hypothetical protein
VLLQELPLEGGRNASASAAAILQTVCAPIPAAAAGAAAGASSKESEASTGSSLAAAAASAGGADATLTAAVQQKVLAAGGLQALLMVCRQASCDVQCIAMIRPCHPLLLSLLLAFNIYLLNLLSVLLLHKPLIHITASSLPVTVGARLVTVEAPPGDTNPG